MFSSGESSFSSIDLIHKEFESRQHAQIGLPDEFMARHRLSRDGINRLISQFARLKVCVVGDLIIDEYISCEPLGMSQEDPTLVVRPIDSQTFMGGAAIVAGHARGFGATTKFVSISGNDLSRTFALDKLADLGVDSKILIDESRPTTLKQRYRSQGKSLLRVSHLHQRFVSKELEEKIMSAVMSEIDEYDLIIFSDFNYGTLPTSLVQSITKEASSRQIALAADSQSSSQIGDIARFKDMCLITPTEREARISTRNQDDGLVVMAEQLRKTSRAANILLTLGGEGVLIHAGREKTGGWLTDRVGALNPTPKDVAGAGDSMLTAAAMTLAVGGSIWEAAVLGSLTAAVQVSQLGNIPISAPLVKDLLVP
jgi:rfaE bifunctional protein kinase chain/domain